MTAHRLTPRQLAAVYRWLRRNIRARYWPRPHMMPPAAAW